MKGISLCLLSLCLFLLVACGGTKKNWNVVFISGSNEYVSHITLKEYAKSLEQKYPDIRITFLQADGPLNEKGEYSNLDGTDALKNCDVLLLFVRRTTIQGKAIEDIKNYVASGKPLVALRTSSHGFQTWPELDKEVLGGNYHNHYEGEPEKREFGPDGMAYPVGEPYGNLQTITVNPENKDHPVLEGVEGFTSKYSLYKTSPIVDDAKLLLTGTTPEGAEPVAWVRGNNGNRVAYIALGGIQDWTNPLFVKLVTNALIWAAGRENDNKEK